MSKTNIEALRLPKQGSREQFRFPGGVRPSDTQLCPWWGTGQWAVRVYPQKPHGWSARLIARVGNNDEDSRSSPLCRVKPQSSQECLVLCRPTLEGSQSPHLSCPGTPSTLPGLQSTMPAWESFSGLAGHGKGFAKPLASY